MGGQSHELEMAHQECVRELQLHLSRRVGCQPWQLRLVLDSAVALEDPARPLAELAPERGLPLRLTIVVSRGVPEHVHANSTRLFELLAGAQASQALALLREGRVNVNACTEIVRVAKGRKFGGASLLQAAAEALTGRSLLAVTRTMLEMGAKTNFADTEGMQPLHVACMRGEGQLAQLLLQHRADAKAVCVGKRTPLHLALEHFLAGSAKKASAEDMALGTACCGLVAAGTAGALNGQRQTPLALARRALSEAVRRVLSEEGRRLARRRPITRAEVLQLCVLPTALVEAFGEELWEGWPKDFMPEQNALIERYFVD